MVRIVSDPLGEALFDLDSRLPGRGAWVCPSRACLDLLNSRSLSHHLKARVNLPSSELFRKRLGVMILVKCRDLLTIGTKAGQTAVGWHAVRETLLRGEASLLIVAADASVRTMSAMRSQSGEIPIRIFADRSLLGSWLGKKSVASVAVRDRRLAERLQTLLDRLTAIDYSSYHSETANVTGGD